MAYSAQDASGLAQELAEALRARHLRVWLDHDQIQVGDNLIEKINDGVQESRIGLVILSPHFIEGTWSARELDAMIKSEARGTPKILPVWYEISEEEVAQKVPALAGRVAFRADQTDVAEMASAIADF